MDFWESFFRVVTLRPKQALVALYWHLTRRKVRARNEIRRGAALLPNAHLFWISTNEERPDLPGRLASLERTWQSPVTFDILVSGPDGPVTAQTLRSLQKQPYPHWRLNSGDEQSSFEAVRSALNDSDSAFVLLLAAGDMVSPPALLYLAEAASKAPDAVFLYGDDDRIVHGLRTDPWFKPDWNEELFLGLDYVSGACAINVEAARRALNDPGVSSLTDLLLALVRQGRPIVHVPRILVHHAAPRTENSSEHLAAVKRYIAPRGGNAQLGPFDTVKVQWPLPSDPPLVSIIVPTRDRLELLQPCIDSLLATTAYNPYEVLVLDNGSVEPATLRYLQSIASHPAVKVIPYNHAYNFSAINNFAAEQARGTYLCLLNNDTEIVSKDWLTELMRYAVRDDIGAAGAKLLYGNGLIQHAGVVVGMGDAAGHAHRFTRSDEPGYFRLPHVTHYVTAVTAACLVVAKAKFDQVGGLDEERLAVAYNDVDLCLKLRQAGYHNVYVPHAVLLHHESMSRGDDKAKQNIDRYSGELATLQERWGTKTFRDPLLNPNLDRYSETFIASIE